MSFPRLNVRLIVGAPNGPRSSVWRVWSQRNDVYLATLSLGGVKKFSFHESGRCRDAFTEKHGPPANLEDRATMKWWRAVTPEPDGTGRASCVLQVGIPTDMLSTALGKPLKPATWVDPAPSGMATVLEMFFTREPEASLHSALLARGIRKVVAFTKLPNGESFGVVRRHSTWAGDQLGMPASHHEIRDFIFSKDDPNKTGLPIRMVMFLPPKDGDSIVGWEYGGYPAPAGTWEKIRPKDKT